MKYTIKTFLLAFALITVPFHETKGTASDSYENLLASLPTPQAQDLYRFGSVPMSPYTGKANISVPIYSAEVCGIPLTVSLNYDTQGVLVNTIPGNVGHGWTINAGGVITREQQGWPDEAEMVVGQNPVRFHNYFHSLQKLNQIGGFSDMSEIAFYSQDTWVMNTYDPDMNRYFTDKYDFCADIFHFNFLGKTGYFFYDTDGKWKVQSDENIKVIFDVDDEDNYIESFGNQQYYSNDTHSWKQHKSIRGFTLIDAAGNKYIFGGGMDDIDYSIDAMNSTDDNNNRVIWTANSWYLTSVRDRFGHIVYDFFYERIGCVYQTIYRKEEQTVKFYGSESGKYKYTNEENPYCITLSSPVYLNMIDINDTENWTAERSIYFSMDESLRGDEMYPYQSTGNGFLLHSQLGQIYRTFAWDNTYNIPTFAEESKYFSTSTERYLNHTGIPLLGEIVISSNGTDEKRYRLTYSRVGKVHLSEVEVIADNGWETNIGKYTLNYNSYEAVPANYYAHTDLWGYYNGNYSTNRDANAGLIQYGMLNEIIYPTGGKTELYYESNWISNSQMGGGLRVSEIADYDIDGVTLLNRRIYTYGNPVSAVVKPRTQGTYYVMSDNLRITYDCDFSLISLVDYYGPAVGYSQVTEMNSTSKKVYTYTTTSDENTTDIYGFESLFNKKGSRAYMRGRLSREDIYDSNNHLCQTKHYSYYESYGDSFTSYATNMSGHSTTFKSIGNNYIFAHRPPIVTLSWVAGCVYPIFLNKYNLSSVTTSTFSSSGTIVEKTSYYRYDIKPKGCTQLYQFIQSETSSGKGTTSTYEYPTDSVKYGNFAQIHYFPIIKTTVSRNNAFLYSDTTVFASSNGHLNPHYEIRNFGQSQDTLVTFNSFYSNGLPEKYTQKGLPPTRIFRDQWGRMLAKVCSTVNLDQIIFDPESTPVNMLTYNGNSIFTIPNTTAIVYKYNDMQLLESITTGLGQTTYFYYDTINRLKEIRNSHDKIQQSFDYHYLIEE